MDLGPSQTQNSFKGPIVPIVRNNPRHKEMVILTSGDGFPLEYPNVLLISV